MCQCPRRALSIVAPPSRLLVPGHNILRELATQAWTIKSFQWRAGGYGVQREKFDADANCHCIVYWYHMLSSVTNHISHSFHLRPQS